MPCQRHFDAREHTINVIMSMADEEAHEQQTPEDRVLHHTQEPHAEPTEDHVHGFFRGIVTANNQLVW